MHAGVAGQLRVEARGKNVILTDGDDVVLAVAVEGCHGLDAVAQEGLDDGGADKDCREGLYLCLLVWWWWWWL